MVHSLFAISCPENILLDGDRWGTRKDTTCNSCYEKMSISELSQNLFTWDNEESSRQAIVYNFAPNTKDKPKKSSQMPLFLFAHNASMHYFVTFVCHLIIPNLRNSRSCCSAWSQFSTATTKATLKEVIHGARATSYSFTSLNIQISAMDVHVLDAAASFALIFLGGFERWVLEWWAGGWGYRGEELSG